MRSFWSDPYLWVHLAGIAAVPLFLELCLLGLAVGSPIFPVGLEWLLVGAIGVAPVLWMQWQRPFSIFSLIVLALQPQRLTDDQRRILRLFRTPLEKGLAVLMAIALLATLWQLFQIAPIASEVTPFTRFGHLGGLLVAAIAFLGSNLFLQVPISVLQTLLTSDRAFAAMEPYSTAQIAQDFTLLGLRVNQILPPVKPAPAKPEPAKASVQPIPPAPKTAAPEIAEEEIAEEEIAEDSFESDFVDELTDELNESALETIEFETAPPSPLEPLLEITVEEIEDQPAASDAAELKFDEEAEIESEAIASASAAIELDDQAIEEGISEAQAIEPEASEETSESDGVVLQIIQLAAEPTETLDPEPVATAPIDEPIEDAPIEAVMDSPDGLDNAASDSAEQSRKDTE